MSAPSVIAGDVASVEQLASRLRGVAEETAYAASRLDRLHDGTWLGAAADKFGAKAGELPPKLHAAADAFRSAEGAYRSYAADLSHGQSEALHAMSLWSSGASASASWRAQVDTLPANDPGRSGADPGVALRDQASVVYRDRHQPWPGARHACPPARHLGCATSSSQHGRAPEHVGTIAHPAASRSRSWWRLWHRGPFPLCGDGWVGWLAVPPDLAAINAEAAAAGARLPLLPNPGLLPPLPSQRLSRSADPPDP